MLQNGPRRRGRTRIIGAQSSNQLWRITTQTNGGGPVVGRDGTIYQGTDLGQFLAINPDGTIKWTISVPRYRVNSTPAILLDGRIAFVDEGGNVYVVNPDGSPSWGYHTGTVYGSPSSAPAVGWDGTIYTGIDQTFYAFNPDGSIKWTYDVGGTIGGSAAVGPGGVVYLVTGYLLALDPNGSLLWATTERQSLGGAPAIGDDGTIYVNSHDPDFYAYNPDGTLKWSYHGGDCCPTDVPSSPAIGRDGTVYAGQTVLGGGIVLAFTPDGTLKWQAPHGAELTPLSIGGDGTIYFGGGTHTPASVFALNPDGTLKWQYDDPVGGYIRTSLAIGRGHRVYGGSLTGLFAIGP